MGGIKIENGWDSARNRGENIPMGEMLQLLQFKFGPYSLLYHVAQSAVFADCTHVIFQCMHTVV